MLCAEFSQSGLEADVSRSLGSKGSLGQDTLGFGASLR
jgi:hypothetical protein